MPRLRGLDADQNATLSSVFTDQTLEKPTQNAFPSNRFLAILFGLAITFLAECLDTRSDIKMAKPHRKLKKANHGRRPANSKARKSKRKNLKTG
jgi:hypothetical protein